MQETGYVIRMRYGRSGEWFRSKLFESFEAAAAYGDRLDDAKWNWSIEQA